jgi:glycosyltransferase involved in cell wall biosynthesis
MKILILAYACSPVIGSEFRLGWNLPIELSKLGFKIDVLLGSSDGEMGEFNHIVHHLKYNNYENINFHLVKPSILIRQINFLNTKLKLSFFFYFALKLWNYKAFKYAKKLNKTFDLTHHLGPIGFREPGFLIYLEKPHIWGPIGGAQSVPVELLKKKSKYYFISRIKNLLNNLQLGCKRIVNTVKISKELTYSTKNNRNIFKQKFNVTGSIISDQAITNEEIIRPSLKKIKKFIFVGSLNSRKNIELVLEIAEELSLSLDIIGDGPLFNKLFKKYSKDNIVFKGNLTREDVLKNINNSDCLLIPSFVEANTSVLYEALASGISVLANDRDGFETELPNMFKVDLKKVNNYHQLKKSWISSINALQKINIEKINIEIKNLQRKKSWKQMAIFYKKIYEKYN